MVAPLSVPLFNSKQNFHQLLNALRDVPSLQDQKLPGNSIPYYNWSMLPMPRLHRLNSSIGRPGVYHFCQQGKETFFCKKVRFLLKYFKRWFVSEKKLTFRLPPQCCLYHRNHGLQHIMPTPPSRTERGHPWGARAPRIRTPDLKTWRKQQPLY